MLLGSIPTGASQSTRADESRESDAEGERLGFQGGEVENLRGVLDVDADDPAFFIEVDDKARCMCRADGAWRSCALRSPRFRTGLTCDAPPALGKELGRIIV